MKDRDKLMHECIELAKADARLAQNFTGYLAVSEFLGKLRVQLSERGFLEMFPDAEGFSIDLDGHYRLEQEVDGVLFFALTDEVAE